MCTPFALEGIDDRLGKMNKNRNDNIDQDSFMNEKVCI